MKFDLIDTFPTLSNAPITEAIIDFQVQLPSSVGLSDLVRFRSGIESRFPKLHERRSVQARIEFQANSTAKISTPSNDPDGYLFFSSEEPLTVQARLDGFTLSRLHPYHDGLTFLGQAQELWKRYVSVAHPISVRRLAIRNVNRIDISPGSELERYVLTFPQIARALPQQMVNFFLRIVVPDPDSGALTVINETLAPFDTQRSVIPLIFDVEAFREINLVPTSEEIWEVLGQLRILKNRMFFRSLTVETLETYR